MSPAPEAPKLPPEIKKFFVKQGRIGGKKAKGKKKVRGDSDYYRMLQALGEEKKLTAKRQEASARLAKCIHGQVRD